MTILSQGARANRNGKQFENMCIPLFESHGFLVLDKKKFKALERKGLLPSKYVLKNAPFQSIYNHEGHTEFVIFDNSAATTRCIRIENKYQESAGSVDEKFPYMLLNAIQAYPEKEVVLVVDGNGYKPGARQWLIDRINENWLSFAPRKDIKIFNIIEFVSWLNSSF